MYLDDKFSMSLLLDIPRVSFSFANFLVYIYFYFAVFIQWDPFFHADISVSI